MKSHPIQKLYRKNDCAIYLHSEVDAIKNAINSRVDLETISRSTLYIARQKMTSSNGSWTQGLAKPCLGCQKCIEDYKLKQVIYTLENLGYAVID